MPPPPSRQHGSALVAALLLTTVGLGMVAALLLAVSAEGRLAAGTRADVQALYAAEAGLNDAIAEIRGAVDADGDGLGTVSRSFGGGSYAALATPTGTSYVIRSTGTYAGSVRTVVARLSAVTTTLFPRAALGTQAVALGSSGSGTAAIDSYDSRVGSYAAQAIYDPSAGGHFRAGKAGNVASTGAISLGSASNAIFGDASPGVGSAVAMVAGAYVSGATVPGSVGTPAAVTAPSFASVGSVSGGDDWRGTIGPGDFGYDAVALRGQAALTIRGPSRIVVRGDVTVANQSRFTFDATDGAIQLFVKGRLSTDPGTTFASVTQKPQDVALYLLGSSAAGQNMTYQAGGQFSGVIYAASADVTLSAGEVFGAVIGRTVRLSGAALLHYDIALGDRPIPLPNAYRLVAWRELPPGSSDAGF
jgi:Tfp pilus assembly protein PilX